MPERASELTYNHAHPEISGETGFDIVAPRHVSKPLHTLMTTGPALFGTRWKAALAAHIGVTRETVSRWCSGTAEMPLWASLFLKEMVKARGTVLSLCDRTGIMLEPWAEAGFDCIAVDLHHSGMTQQNGITRIGADILSWLPPPRRYAIVFAFPPCTDLSVSGARWFQEKGVDGLSRAVEVVEACRRTCEWSEAPWMIENPVSTLSSYWRKPDFFFDPFEFGGWLQPIGDQYPKRTSVWTGNGFRKPEKRPVEPVNINHIHNQPRTAARGDIRSMTPKGFALAVFAANSPYPKKPHA